MKKIVVYYSRTGNTRFVAEKIAEVLKADLCEVIDKKKRKGRLGFITGGYDATREKLTKITVSKSIEDYDLVIVGSPVWAGKITPAIRTFLVSNDFSGKDFAFFLTQDGDEPEKTLENMKEIVNPKSQFTDLAITKPLENKEETEKQITDWCNQF
jgi:flavodoxin